MSEFDYLAEKIAAESVQNQPFPHLLIADFLSPAHLAEVIAAEEIRRPEAADTESLIADLVEQGYDVKPFPGCTASVEEYLTCYNRGRWPVDTDLLEGFGLTLRLNRYRTPVLERLVAFMQSAGFLATLDAKFGIDEAYRVETAIQKYLSGYEISPHSDIRTKRLTYMLNINTSDEAERLAIHTHLMRFKPAYEYVTSFWEHNPQVERGWVPWDWCESVLTTPVNNSIVIFAPDHRAMHAVKLRYDHLRFQRTQVYGNLWLQNQPVGLPLAYQDLDLLARTGPLPRPPASIRFRQVVKGALRRLGVRR